MWTRRVITRLCLCLLTVDQFSSLVNCVARPNIVTIIADDLGWNDVGFHGSDQIPTPNIDALAYNGVILNRHYTMAICTPSRTAYLTGRYPLRSGMQGSPLKAGEPRGIPLTEVLLPQHLKKLGYYTHIVGKWHVGNYRTEFTPPSRGFDSFLGYWDGYNGYIKHWLKEGGKDGFNFRRDFCPTYDYEGQYSTDVFTREAVDIIRRHDTSQPLYLHLAHQAVHAGNDEHPLEVPDVEAAHRRFSHIATPKRRLYAAMMSKLDDSVGAVVQALADRGIVNNTIILFTTDNGAPTLGPFANSGSNWPLKGIKATLHEGGVRGAALIWSSLIRQPRRVSNQLFHLTDWLPTFYSAAGGNVTDLGVLDGVDQWESLVNNRSSPRTQILLNIDDVANIEALISTKWKISKGVYNGGIYDGYYGDSGRADANPPYNISQIVNSHANSALGKHISERDLLAVEELRATATVVCPRIEKQSVPSCKDYCLYNIDSDPCEMVDLAWKYDWKVKELVKKLVQYRGVAVYQGNQPVDPASDPARHNNTWVSWRDEPGSYPDLCRHDATRLKASFGSALSIKSPLGVIIALVATVIIL